MADALVVLDHRHPGVVGDKSDQPFATTRNHQVEGRSEEHTSELQSLMRISYAVFCLKKKPKQTSKSQACQYINQNIILSLKSRQQIHKHTKYSKNNRQWYNQ